MESPDVSPQPPKTKGVIGKTAFLVGTLAATLAAPQDKPAGVNDALRKLQGKQKEISMVVESGEKNVPINGGSKVEFVIKKDEREKDHS